MPDDIQNVLFTLRKVFPPKQAGSAWLGCRLRTGQLSGGAETAVAGQDDRDGVAAVRGADSATRGGTAEVTGELGVGASFAAENGQRAAQTARWNEVPRRSSAGEKVRRRAAKCSPSCRAVSTRTG